MSLDIPAFLKLSEAERKAAWKGRRLTHQGTNFKRETRPEEPATKKLRKEIEKQKAEARAERFKLLKERYAK